MRDQFRQARRREVASHMFPSSMVVNPLAEPEMARISVDSVSPETEAANAPFLPLPGSAIRSPWNHVSSPAAPKVAATPAPTLERARILVIDDEVIDMQLMADILGAEHEMLFASNGASALEVATRHIPDLILMDVMMPDLDGYEVLRRLKADCRTSEIPVIFITGRTDVAAETRGLELGAVDYITKPIHPQPVRARVNTQLKLKLARDKFERLASTDGLTGVANRCFFDSMLAYEYARHLRSGAELSLVLLDIDHFKQYNDRYGHPAGDQCLRSVAQAIATVVSRATDIVARYGGEEFVLLLPETHLKGAVTLAEKVRESIDALTIPHAESVSGYVTASLGVASARMVRGETILDLVEEADVQLYAAKAAGRNRVSARNLDGPRIRQ